jgi:PAS domain S-box-containing protein
MMLPAPHDAQSDGHYRALVEALAQITWTVNGEGLAQQDSPSWRAYTGQSAEELRQQGFWTVIHPDDRARVWREWATAVREERTFSSEHRLRRHDGVYRTFLVHGVPVRTDDGVIRAWVGAHIDHPDRVEAERQQTPTAEQADNVHLQQLLDVLPVGVAIADAQGRATMLNPVFTELWGEDASLPDRIERYAELRGWWPDGRRIAAEDWGLARALQHGEVVIGEEIEIESFAGKRKAILNNAAPMRDASGAIIGGVVAFLEITERRQLQRSAVATAHELTTIFEAITDGVVVYAPDRTVVRTNGAMRRMLGFDTTRDIADDEANKAVGQLDVYDVAGQLIPPEHWATSYALRGQSLGDSKAMEERFFDLRGKEHSVLVSAAPLRAADGRIEGAVIVCHEVTERRQLERAARARASELEAIFEAVADGIAAYDAEGRVTRMNPTVRTLLAMDAEPDFTARSLSERVPLMPARDMQGKLISQEQWAVHRALRGEVLTGSNRLDLTLRTLDGRDIGVSISGAPIRDAADRITGAVCVFRDVTDERQMERERSDMLQVVAHELRQPLTSMKARVQMLRIGLARGKAVIFEAFAPIEQDIERINILVNDLLDAAKMESETLTLDKQPCDVVALCQRVIDGQATATGRTIVAKLPGRPLETEADAVRITQVVANLLSNALKYSPAERPVQVEVRRVMKRNGTRQHGARAKAVQEIRVSIQDQGPGIPAEAIPHLFDRFYRVPGITAQQTADVSLGLGLYISRKLIELHGGRIHVKSVVGRGTTMWFTLPYSSGSISPVS